MTLRSTPTATPARVDADAGVGTPDSTTRLTLLLLSALTVMSGATIAPALPAMQQHFAGTPQVEVLVKLALTILGLVIAVSAPLSGVLADRYGRRPVLIGALLLYAVGGASGLVASSLGAVLAGRVVLGLAVAGTMTAAGALVNDLFSGPQRGRFLSQQAAFTSFGGAVLLPLGGLLAGLSWRAPFALYALALLLLPLVLRLPRGVPVLPQTLEPERPPRWGAIGLVYALALGYMVVFYLMPAQGPFLLGSLGARAAATGLLLGTFTLMAALTSLAFSRFAGRFDPRRVAALGLGGVAAGWLIVSQAPGLGVALAGLIVGGLGGGLVFPNLYTWLADLTPPAWRGRVTAGMSSAVFLGQFLSPLLLASPAGQEGRGYVWGAVVAAVMAGALLVLSARPLRHDK